MKTSLKIAITISIMACSADFAKTNLPQTSKLMPKDSVLVVNINDYTALSKTFQGSNLYKFWNDPAMKPFVDKFSQACNSKMQAGQEQYLIDILNDPNSFPQGRIAFALLMGESTLKGEDAGGIGVFEFGSNLDKAKQSVDKIVEKAIADGATRKKQNVAGVEVVTIIKERSQPMIMEDANMSALPTRSPFELNYAFVNDAMVVSADTNFEVMTFLLAQLKGKSSGPVLADDPDYIAAMQATNLSDSAQLYVNIKSIINKAVQEDTSGMAAQQLDMMGLGNISCFAMQLNASEKTSDNMSIKAMLKMNGPKKGFMKMFEFEKSGISVPRFVDKTASDFRLINWDINKAFQQLATTAAAMNPQMGMYFNMPFPSPDGSRMMTLQNDIFAYIGSQIVITQSADESASADSAPSSVVAIAINNQTKLEESLSVLHSMFTGMANTQLKREFLGHNIYLIDLQNSPMFGGGRPAGVDMPADGTQPAVPAAPKIGFTVTDSHLIIAMESDLEKTLRLLENKDAPALEAEKWFVYARGKLPSAVGSAGLINVQKTYELLWKQLKAKGLGAFNSEMGTETEIDEFLDFKLLPEYDAVKKYLGISTGYLNSTDDGFYCESKAFDMPK